MLRPMWSCVDCGDVERKESAKGKKVYRTCIYAQWGQLCQLQKASQKSRFFSETFTFYNFCLVIWKQTMSFLIVSNNTDIIYRKKMRSALVCEHSYRGTGDWVPRVTASKTEISMQEVYRGLFLRSTPKGAKVPWLGRGTHWIKLSPQQWP